MSDIAVRRKRDDLLERLQLALELEWSTLPPYLVALLSIRRPKNREAADIIRGVAMEEMLHFALVANVINAVGGTPRIGPGNCPSYPLDMTFRGRKFADRDFTVNLERFSKGVIGTFMKIEQPVQPIRPEMAAMAVTEITIPEQTIGTFYATIETLLRELDRDMEGGLFVGDPARQLKPDYFWGGGGHIAPVENLETALAVLGIVVEQGEGAGPWAQERLSAASEQPMEMGHYYRYAEIFYGRRFVRGDHPDRPPTGDPVAVDYDAVFPIRTNPKSSDYAAGSTAASLNDAFNRQYTMMLRQIDQAVNGQPTALYTAIGNGMHDLASTALDLMATPIDGSESGETACPTFEWVV